ncbi:hypothetical protein LIA77_06846 [Sarocladium implicatum]|nr:hypothetical protein LIA77_06846 [Sarocladium implicatum]
MRTRVSTPQGLALASFLGLAAARDICCPRGAEFVEVVSIRPVKAVCGEVTSTWTETQTAYMHCGSSPHHEATIAPGSPPQTTTVTKPCDGRGSCHPGTTTPSPGCSKDCTVIVVPSPAPEPPKGTATITSTCADNCVPTTIPPPAGCTKDCTAAVVLPPKSSGLLPVATTTITSLCTNGPDKCKPTTLQPGPDCTAGTCTATAIQTRPVTTTRAPQPGSAVTTMTTSICTDGSEKCKPTTILPGPDCTTGTCTVSVIETPAVTTTTVTSICTDGPSECKPATISPGPDCTTGTCTVSVIQTPAVPGIQVPAETTTVTSLCTDGPPDCVATTIFPTPGCTKETCTVSVIETPSATTTTVSSTCTDGPEECIPTTIFPTPGCTKETCTVSVIVTPSGVPSVPAEPTLPVPTTITETSTCTQGPAECIPTTILPPPECTAGTCTVSVIVTPPGVPTTVTETSTCTKGPEECTPTTIVPGPECTAGTCTISVIVTPSGVSTVPEETETVAPTTTADPPLVTCSIPDATRTIRANGRTGVTSSIPVPTCATKLRFRVVGGSGSGSTNYGADIRGDIPVTPGQSVQAIAGGSGVIGESGTGYGNGGKTVGEARGGGAGSALSLEGKLLAVGGGGGGGWQWHKTNSNGVDVYDVRLDSTGSEAGVKGKSGEYWLITAPQVILGRANGGSPGTSTDAGKGGVLSGAFVPASKNGNQGTGRDGGGSVTVPFSGGDPYGSGAGGGGYYGGGSGCALRQIREAGGNVSLFSGGGGGSSFLASDVSNGTSALRQAAGAGYVEVIFSN